MRRVAVFTLAVTCMAPPGLAQSPFEGVWKLDTNNVQASSTIYDISLQDGIYACRSCRPAWSVPADGSFHPVTGHSDFDETSVRVVDGRSVVFTRRLEGRGVYQAIDVISEDGNFSHFHGPSSVGLGSR